MNIKENRKFNIQLKLPNFASLLFGPDQRILSFTLTIGIAIISFLLGSIIFYFNNNGIEIYSVYLLNSILLLSGIALGLGMVSLIASSEFGKSGWPIWRRVIIFHFIVTASIMVFNVTDTQDVREKVQKMEFITSNVKDCKYGVRMTSDNMTYLFCTDYDSEYEKLSKAEKREITLISRSQSTSVADHYEYTELVK